MAAPSINPRHRWPAIGVACSVLLVAAIALLMPGPQAGSPPSLAPPSTPATTPAAAAPATAASPAKA